MCRQNCSSSAVQSALYTVGQVYADQAFLRELSTDSGTKVQAILSPAGDLIRDKQLPVLLKLESLASRHPYYKYNQVWSREVQNLVRYSIPSLPGS
jgi:hypothetical protein